MTGNNEPPPKLKLHQEGRPPDRPPDRPSDRPPDRPSRRRRIRGHVAASIRRTITRPTRPFIPLAPLTAAHRVRRRIVPGRYTDAPAFTIRWIDPTHITRSVLESVSHIPQWGRVVAGDWDCESEPFDERAVPRGLRQRYIEGKRWADTALVDAFADQLDRFGTAWGSTSWDGFDRRCQAIDRLATSIREDGYRRQETLHGPNAYATTARLDEISVDIGRDGTCYWRGYGQHRLALAKLFEVETVPVLVQRRHADWQALRDELRESQNPDGSADLSAPHDRMTGATERSHSGVECDLLTDRVRYHPDLVDLRPTDGEVTR